MFFRYRHYQRRDEVKRSNRDNQCQNDEHHAFFQLNSFKIAAVVKRPVTHPNFIFFSIRNQLGNERRRILRIGQSQTQPTDIFTQSVQDLRILDMRHGQCVIDLINTGFYHTDYIKLLQARHYAGRSNISLRRNHSNFTANLRAQCLSKPLTQNNIKFARLQIVKTAGRHILAVINDIFFFRRQDTAYLYTAYFSGISKQSLIGNIRRAGQYFLFAFYKFAQTLPTRRTADIVIADFRMRCDVQQLAAYLFLKSVHH